VCFATLALCPRRVQIEVLRRECCSFPICASEFFQVPDHLLFRG
jgi:hypothetical protein